MARREASPDPETFAPLNLLYLHFHDAIRAELVSLETALGKLEATTTVGTLTLDLLALKDRYVFLQQIYGYHSNVEDEVRHLSRPAQSHAGGCGAAATSDLSVCVQVVYPALEAKVKNVTQAYSVEHEDEVRQACCCAPLRLHVQNTLAETACCGHCRRGCSRS